MTAAEVITWIISPIALVALVACFVILMLRLLSKEKMLIKSGAMDEEILANAEAEKSKKDKVSRIVLLIVQAVVCLFMVLIVILGIYSAAFKNNFPLFGKQVLVIGSNSMATVHPKNEKYVTENSLNNQFRVDDLIVIKSLPKEEDLKLYDVVTYYDKKSGTLIIHRIINIQKTESGTQYTLRGDANSSSDMPITYEDMRGIYKNEKTVGVGVIVRFAQSGQGLIAIVFCLFICIFEELVLKNATKAQKERMEQIIQNIDSQIDIIEIEDAEIVDPKTYYKRK